MNPLLEDAVSFLQAGKKFTGIHPEKIGEANREVEFFFTDQTSDVRQYECDHQTFMGWWKHTCVYLRHVADAFEAANPNT
ncbi:MAG: hypothetical protein ABIK89_20740 [Planctomycetota bacterium]